MAFNTVNLHLRAGAPGDLMYKYDTGPGAAADQALSHGFYEIGSQIASASAGWLPAPYPGAEVVFRKIGSGTQLMEIDAGSGDTSITFDGTNRRVTLGDEGDGCPLVGSLTS